MKATSLARSFSVNGEVPQEHSRSLDLGHIHHVNYTRQKSIMNTVVGTYAIVLIIVSIVPPIIIFCCVPDKLV